MSFKNPVFFYVGILSLSTVLIVFLDVYDTNFSYHDILVESHGLLFDLAVLGVILAIYESYRSKKEKISKYEDSISDYRNWKAPEASLRILGDVKRLNKEHVTDIVLRNCYLREMVIEDVNLENSDLSFVNLELANVNRSIFVNVNLHGANLKGTQFENVNFSECYLRHVQINEKTVFSSCEFNNAKVDKTDWISELDKLGIKGHKDISLRYYVSTEEHVDEYGYTYFQIKRL